MTRHQDYVPSTGTSAFVEKDGEKWTLVLTREFRHAPANVWEAITDPAHLAAWAPFDADRSLASEGPVTLSTVGGPQLSDSTVRRAEAPRLLEYDWGGGNLRWELEPVGKGTRLTLWHNIDKRYISWGAAGWHVCFDVLDHLLTGDPMGRLVYQDALQNPGWQSLAAQYARQFNPEPHS